MDQHDRTGDINGDITWMTYAELGTARRISAASAKRLAIRRHWRRSHGNDGTARVAVPVTEALPREDKIGDLTSDDTGDITRAVAALEGAVSTLREQLEQANERTEAERARADRAEQGREGERARADALRDRLEVLQAQLAAAERASDGVQAARTGAEERAGRAENDVFELKGQLATAQIAAAEAGREAEAARQATHAFLDEDAARRSLGLLARLRVAWRGA